MKMKITKGIIHGCRTDIPVLKSNIMRRAIAILLSCLLICSLLTACGKKELTDGTHTIQVTLSGGSGRAHVESPATIVVDGKSITATIVWSSPNYEYMIVDGIQYDPIQTEGNSTFKIPIVLDVDMAISASTVAMSKPYLIEYTLHFDSSTIK